jgi:DNA helicase-2/ATP-dependent DNA helicase PcrA
MDSIAEFQSDDVETIIRVVLEKTGYRDWLTEDGSEEGHERARNVDELVVAAQEFDREHPDDGGLEVYLQQAALVNDIDAWQQTAEYVSLMTIHAAKGLEFPCVFIVGLEDGILPHERSCNNNDEIEEERRLFFVGITRAEQELQISRCLERFRRGSNWPAIGSRFLMELPRKQMDLFEPKSDVDADEVFDDIDPWLHEGVPVDEKYRIVKAADRAARPVPSAPFPRLVTAAELAARQAAVGSQTRCHPDVFAVGMQVEHPEYGVGSILAITGQFAKRTATVEFPMQGKKRFRLAFSLLRPAKTR